MVLLKPRSLKFVRKMLKLRSKRKCLTNKTFSKQLRLLLPTPYNSEVFCDAFKHLEQTAVSATNSCFETLEAWLCGERLNGNVRKKSKEKKTNIKSHSNYGEGGPNSTTSCHVSISAENIGIEKQGKLTTSERRLVIM